MKVFEQDSKHTRDMQKDALSAEIKRDTRAQWMSFIIMLVALAVTAVSIIFGKNIAPGIITGLGTLFVALRVLYIGKKKEPPIVNKNKEE